MAGGSIGLCEGSALTSEGIEAAVPLPNRSHSALHALRGLSLNRHIHGPSHVVPRCVL